MGSIWEIWERQSFSNNRQVVIKEKIEEVSGLNCFVGTICFSGAKVFILELESRIAMNNKFLQKFVGVEIQIIQTEGHSELVIILLENDLSEIFCYFIDDVIQSLRAINNQDVALEKISSRLSYWKRIFSKISGEKLTSQQQSGLYGELLFLSDLLEHYNDKLYIIKGWHGPQGSNQDFWYNGLAVEVKTSRSNKPTIRISNEYQLDNTGLKSLYIYFFRLSEYKGGSETLLKLICHIRQLLDDETLLLFNGKLESLGISPDSEQYYNDVSYSINSEKTYSVSDSFPKIIQTMLNEAISSVSYEISPGLCAEFEFDRDQLFNQIADGNK